MYIYIYIYILLGNHLVWVVWVGGAMGNSDPGTTYTYTARVGTKYTYTARVGTTYTYTARGGTTYIPARAPQRTSTRFLNNPNPMNP